MIVAVACLCVATTVPFAVNYFSFCIHSSVFKLLLRHLLFSSSGTFALDGFGFGLALASFETPNCVEYWNWPLLSSMILSP